jgi:hypothetical protein
LAALGRNYQELDQLFQMKKSTQQHHMKEEGLNFQEQGSLAKQSGATDDVWYDGYHADWTWKAEQGGPPWVSLLGLMIQARRPITEAI